MSIYVTRNTDGVLIKAPCLKAVGSGGNLGLPPTFPLSATWACYPDSLAADFYDIFTYGSDPFDASNYYMAATWTDGVGGGPFWNLGCGINNPAGPDYHTTGTAFTSNRWYYQGFHVMKDSGGFVTAEFFYDLVAGQVLSATSTSSDTAYFAAPGSTSSIVCGDASWPQTAPTENWNGYLQGYKIWSAYLSQAELLAESKSPYPVLPKYYNSLWACLPMKTANDYSCEFIRSRNRRQWKVPSAVAGVVKTGNFRAPLQRRQRIWYYGDALTGYDQVSTADILLGQGVM